MQRQPASFIDGKWITPATGSHLDIVNPATEEKIGQLAPCTPAHVDAAVLAARREFPAWRNTSPAGRARLLGAVAAGISDRKEELAKLITLEMGMPASMSVGYQVEPPVMVIESFIELLERFSFEEQNQRSLSLLEPVGVCALITPWNFPLTQTMLKLAPALCAGCTTILKPSEFTSMSAAVLAEIIEAAGMPPGVFNLLQGDGPTVGAELARHPEVDMITLTGSTRAGIAVARAAAESLKRVTLELGGKSPLIICDDADLTEAVPFAVKKCFSNSGQACDAPTRMLVPEKYRDEVLELAQKTADSLVTGDPLDPATNLGPLVNRAQYERVIEFIRKGTSEGARLVTGGSGRPDGLERGFFVRPTIFAEVDNRMEIAQQEIFGPVLSVISYHDDSDAVRIANDSQYGLASYVFSSDDRRAASIAAQLRTGQVRINAAPFDISAPFGGFKKSGYGRELGDRGFEEFLEVKACMGLRR